MSDLFTIFEAGDPALVAVAKSFLDSAGIDFAVKGEALQDLLGWGRFPSGSNPLVGPVAFQVRPGDAEKAKSLLGDLRSGEKEEGP